MEDEKLISMFNALNDNIKSLNDNFTEQLKTVNQRLDTIEVDLGTVKSDVVGLKTDVKGLKVDVSGLKADVAELKTNVAGLQGRQIRMEEKMDLNFKALFDARGISLDKDKELVQRVEVLEEKQEKLSLVSSSHENRLEKLEKIG